MRGFPTPHHKICSTCKASRKTTKARQALKNKYKLDENGKRPPKTLKERKFIKEYSKHGNGAKAVRDAGYNAVTVQSQGVIARGNIKKLSLGDAMEKHGLTDEYLTEQIKIGIQADKLVSTNTGTREYPDHQTRHKYTETALRLRGHGKEGIVVDQRKQYVVMLPTRVSDSDGE